MIGQIVLLLVVNDCQKLLHELVDIVAREIWIVLCMEIQRGALNITHHSHIFNKYLLLHNLNGVILASVIETESVWRAIAIVEDPCEEVRVAAKDGAGSPDHLEGGRVDTELVVVIVVPSKEESIVSHLHTYRHR